MALPIDPAARKAVPLFRGCLAYFPDALAAVAELSAKGNDQHNPGEPLFWDRSKSGDEADALVRHLLEHGSVDSDGIRHTAKVAWRALALLQKELEADGAEMARGAREGVEESPCYFCGRFGCHQHGPSPVESAYLDSFGPNPVNQRDEE